MKVYIRHVDHIRTNSGAVLHAIDWSFDHNHISRRYDGHCYTWDGSEAKRCEDARIAGRAVELVTARTNHGERIQSVTLAEATVNLPSHEQAV
jgi:hypothetical protein